ncbi:MAG: SpoIIE family protein phosphatase [Chromatiaceae bacterium]|nr:SpoIIE family protein phosphatase [Chromatiaceae bacterium]
MDTSLTPAPALLDPAPLDPAVLGTALRPVAGERLCGDQLGCWRAQPGLLLALADGLGHGAEAHRAASTAMRTLAALAGAALAEAFAHCDRRLNATRGAALALVRIEPEMAAGSQSGGARLTHAAVGNIRTLVWSQGRLRRLGGARGIVGAGYRELRQEQLALDPGDWLALYSDGLPEEAAIEDALARLDRQGVPRLDRIAAELLERWANPNDDAALLLYRQPG